VRPYRLARAHEQEVSALARRLEAGDDLREVLSLEESEGLRTLRTPKRRRDRLAGRLAAKRLIAEILGEQEGRALPLSEVLVLNAQDGSPYCASWTDPRMPCLSISHSRGSAAAALSKPGARIGVDLEAVEKRPASWTEVFAHPEEQARLGSAQEQTRLWTLKEAALKLLGLGLSVDMRDVRFTGPSDQDVELHRGARARWEALSCPRMRFDSFQTGDEILSVAYTPDEEVPA
jgi:4'-phosphopantetheinyl transferase